MKRSLAFISEHASPLAALGGVDSGGQNVYVAEVAKHLATLGYHIDIYTRWENPELPEIISWSDNVRVIHVAAGPKKTIPKEELLPFMTAFTENMMLFMVRNELSYSLVHAHFFMSGLVACELKQKLGIPFVITFHALGEVRKKHQGDQDHFPIERKAVELRAVREADRIIAECPQDREDLIDLYNADPKRITMIPAGFNPDEFFPMDKLIARNAVDIKTNEKIILQLGRMVPRKGVETVVRAMKHLTEPKARLVIVGGESDDPDPHKTPEIGRLLNIAEDLGIENKITFAGRKDRSELKYYYNAADVFVSTPWYEPFGITPVESMACGTPVVGARVGGIKYTVRDGKTGYLVPPKDEESLAKALDKILQNEETMDLMKKNSLERAQQLFTWRGIAHSLCRVYESLVVEQDVNVKDTLQLINHNFDQLKETVELSKEILQLSIADAAHTLAEKASSGHMILACGNGGSATDAEHFVGELVGRFQVEGRKALPAIALSSDSASITAWANDYSYDTVYSRQIEAYGRPGDVLVGISTSGNSENIIQAMKTARSLGLTTIALLGKQGGKAKQYADIAIVVPAIETTRIQEIHINVIHTVCEVIERRIMSDQYSHNEVYRNLSNITDAFSDHKQLTVTNNS